jgi:hypothetical protein
MARNKSGDVDNKPQQHGLVVKESMRVEAGVDHLILTVTQDPNVLGGGCSSAGKPGVSWCFLDGTPDKTVCVQIGFSPPVEVKPHSAEYYQAAHGSQSKEHGFNIVWEDPAVETFCKTSAQWNYESKGDFQYGYAPMCHMCYLNKKDNTIRAFWLHGCKDTLPFHYTTTFEQLYYFEEDETPKTKMRMDPNHCHWSWARRKPCKTMFGESYVAAIQRFEKDLLPQIGTKGKEEEQRKPRKQRKQRKQPSSSPEALTKTL